MPEINVERKQFWFLHHSNRRHRQFACHKMEIRQHYRKDTRHPHIDRIRAGFALASPSVQSGADGVDG
jgi:hypothetical protein